MSRARVSHSPALTGSQLTMPLHASEHADQLTPEVKEQILPLSKGFVPYEIELGYDHWNACESRHRYLWTTTQSFTAFVLLQLTFCMQAFPRNCLMMRQQPSPLRDTSVRKDRKHTGLPLLMFSYGSSPQPQRRLPAIQVPHWTSDTRCEHGSHRFSMAIHSSASIGSQKNHNIRTVVNKLDSIESEFRVFQMEVLAGDDDLLAEAVSAVPRSRHARN